MKSNESVFSLGFSSKRVFGAVKATLAMALFISILEQFFNYSTLLVKEIHFPPGLFHCCTGGPRSYLSTSPLMKPLKVATGVNFDLIIDTFRSWFRKDLGVQKTVSMKPLTFRHLTFIDPNMFFPCRTSFRGELKVVIRFAYTSN